MDWLEPHNVMPFLMPLFQEDECIASLMEDRSPEEPPPTFQRPPRTVTIRDRTATKNNDGTWKVTYSNQRSAQMADDGITLRYYITPQHYFTYKNVFAFMGKKDNSQNVLASKPPI